MKELAINTPNRDIGRNKKSIYQQIFDIERTLLDLKHSVGYFSEDLEEEELELSYHIEVIKTTIYLLKEDEKENYDDLIHQQSLLNLLEFNQAIQEVV